MRRRGRRPLALGSLCGAVLAALVVACEEQPSVPYIAPRLDNWPASYRGTAGLKVHVFGVGTLTTGTAAIFGGLGRERERRLWAFVVEHPAQGLIVIDTGLNHRRPAGGRGPLDDLLGGTASGALAEGEDLPTQMKGAGLDPDSVRWVLLSDLQFFNAGEVEAFEKARVVVSRSELEAARAGGPDYAQRLFDDVESWKMLDWEAAEPLGTFAAADDLFGDGSCIAVDARGASAGNLAFLLRLPARPILLAGALAPTAQTVRYAAKPPNLADSEAWWDRVWRLKRFRDLEPRLLVVPGQDATVLRDVQGVVWHDFDGRTPRPRATRTRATLPLPGSR